MLAAAILRSRLLASPSSISASSCWSLKVCAHDVATLPATPPLAFQAGGTAAAGGSTLARASAAFGGSLTAHAAVNATAPHNERMIRRWDRMASMQTDVVFDNHVVEVRADP